MYCCFFGKPADIYGYILGIYAYFQAILFWLKPKLCNKIFFFRSASRSLLKKRMKCNYWLKNSYDNVKLDVRKELDTGEQGEFVLTFPLSTVNCPHITAFRREFSELKFKPNQTLSNDVKVKKNLRLSFYRNILTQHYG